MKTTRHVLFFASIGMLFAGLHAEAQNASDYDTTNFNPPTGHISFVASKDQRCDDVVTDSAGNIFVVGVNGSAGSTDRQPFLAKLDSAGALVSTFGNGGMVILPIFVDPNIGLNAIDVALAANGKIYVSLPAIVNTSGNDFSLLRVLADGSGLDTSFGSYGLATMDFDLAGPNHPSDDQPFDLAVQSDGKIVVVGTIERIGGTDKDIGVARFTTGGSVDTTFGGGNGKAVAWFDLGGNNADYGFGVALGSSGRIIVVGQAGDSVGVQLAVAVFTASGDPDTTFAGHGRAAYQYLDPSSGLTAIANSSKSVTVVPSKPGSNRAERILVGGTSSDPIRFLGTMEMAVLCLELNGAPCSSFGVLGWTLIDFSDNNWFGIGDTADEVHNIMYHEASDRLTVVGGAHQIVGGIFRYGAVARLNALTGALDSAFGYGGARYFTEVEGFDLTYGTLDPSNRIVLINSKNTYSAPGIDIWVGRLGTP